MNQDWIEYKDRVCFTGIAALRIRCGRGEQKAVITRGFVRELNFPIGSTVRYSVFVSPKHKSLGVVFGRGVHMTKVRKCGEISLNAILCAMREYKIEIVSIEIEPTRPEPEEGKMPMYVFRMPYLFPPAK